MYFQGSIKLHSTHEFYGGGTFVQYNPSAVFFRIRLAIVSSPITWSRRPSSFFKSRTSRSDSQ